MLQSRPPGVFAFGAPAWNDSRCPEQAGEGVHAAMVPWVFALRLYSYGFQVPTRFLVFIRDTSHSSSFPEHSFHFTFEKNIHFSLDPVSPSHQTYPQPPHHLSPPFSAQLILELNIQPTPTPSQTQTQSDTTGTQLRPDPKSIRRPRSERPFLPSQSQEKNAPLPTYLHTRKYLGHFTTIYPSITIHHHPSMHHNARLRRRNPRQNHHSPTQPNPTQPGPNGESRRPGQRVGIRRYGYPG